MAISSVGGNAFRPITEVLKERVRDIQPAPTPGAEPAGFASQLSSALDSVESSISGADDAISALASGENVDLHGSMIALEKADIALRMTVSARDKFIAAYEQIMNMSL